MDANLQGTRELDQNGETAALIKIVTTERGFGFSCGAIGIVKTLETPGEIWLYVPRGAQKITIKHPQLGVLRDWHFTTTIQGGRTYELILNTGKVTTIVKQARTSQYVVFQLTPKNAIVELDGQLLQTNDGVARKLIKFGTYNYKVQAPDYLPFSGKVTINNPNEKTIENVVLKPNFSMVTINVDDNSEIWINGEKRGQGSWFGNLGAGEYEFEAKKPNHRSTLLKKNIIVTEESQTYQLEKPKPIMGEANIDSDPSMAELLIDGKKHGETPFYDSIMIGNHRVTISKKGYETYHQDINIEEDKRFDLTAQLIKISENVIKKQELSSKTKFDELKYTGKKTDDGGVYYGNLKKGKPNGIGKATYNNGNKYEGEYVNGKRHGHGVYTFYDGEIYDGEWFEGQQHGKGIYYFNNNNRYEGLWYRDYQQGQGIMYYFNGDKYDGNWQQDKRSGYGVYTYSNGAYYKGEWKNDRKEGTGMMDWGDGSVYEGEWAYDNLFGKGTYKYANGDMYTGQFDSSQMHGKGIYKFNNGDVYEGDYRQGERTGQGIFKYASGDLYTGDFKNGNRDGHGTYKWVDGSIYIGQWKNDKPHGKGHYTDSKGKSYEGLFKDGKPSKGQ